MKEGWMKNIEGWRMSGEGWWFQAAEGFLWLTDGQTNKQIDICECRVAFATEKSNTLNIDYSTYDYPWWLLSKDLINRLFSVSHDWK